MMTVQAHDREILEQRIDALQVLAKEMFRSRDVATNQARDAMERRLESMNEFRDQLKDQASRFINREEHTTLENRIGRAETRLTSTETKVYLGGAGLAVFVLLLQLMLNLYAPEQSGRRGDAIEVPRLPNGQTLTVKPN